MFVDEVEIEVNAGRGGDGLVAFRREKYVPFGGPAGGDGGKGGDVVFVATRNVNTLSDLRYQKHARAQNGHPGGPNRKTGRNGGDAELKVPCGTLVYDRDSGELLADLKDDGHRVVIARGGDGGLGNTHFATSTNRAPRRATPGHPGEHFKLRLELKLLADAGLVGFPSVGKSTLITALSNARPKIAAYPFTTLSPNLGVVSWKGGREFIVADIPGLIEGAHQGQGLGIRFLKHVERTRLLVHVLEVTPQVDEVVDEDLSSQRDPIADLDIIRTELEQFNPALLDRPQLVVLNKVDLPFVRAQRERVQAWVERELQCPFLAISAATGEGLDAMRDALGRAVFGTQTGADALEWWER